MHNNDKMQQDDAAPVTIAVKSHGAENDYGDGRVHELFPSGRFSTAAVAPMLDMSKPFLERYKLQKRIHAVGPTAIYLAEDTVDASQVALKIISLTSSTPRALDRIEKAFAISHVVANPERVLWLDQLYMVPNERDPECAVLIMEYADGGNFRQWLAGHRADFEYRVTEGLRHFRTMVESVEAVHRAGVMHLDVKPENFVFVGDELKITDFYGSAVAAQTGSELAVDEVMGLTHIRGTPHYMSPEQFGDDAPSRVSVSSDMYSLGVILHEITGEECRLPIVGSYPQIEQLHRRGFIPELQGVLPPARPIVLRCLQKDPQARYKSAGELLHDLDGLDRRVADIVLHGQVAVNDTDTKELWDEVNILMAGSLYMGADRLCREMLACSPDHTKARTLHQELGEIIARGDSTYSAIEKDMDTRPLEELVLRFEAAQHDYPDHPMGQTVGATLNARIVTVREALERVGQAAKSSSPELVFGYLEQALAADPKCLVLQRAVEVCRDRIGSQKELRQKRDKARDYRQVSRITARIEEEDKALCKAFAKSSTLISSSVARWNSRGGTCTGGSSP